MAHNAPRNLVDSLEQRLSQLTRFPPSNIVMDLSPMRVDRVCDEFPGYIDFMQQVLDAARHKKQERGRN